jgi:hypothetical protein
VSQNCCGKLGPTVILEKRPTVLTIFNISVKKTIFNTCGKFWNLKNVWQFMGLIKLKGPPQQDM